MAGGHDQLWKDLIRAFPVDFLRLVDDELAPWLELSSLRLEPAEEFLDQPTGAERRMDLVGSVRTIEGNEVFVHVEIERCFRSKFPLRLWTYNRLLGLRRRLPVHTMVLYLKGGPAGPEISRFTRLRVGEKSGDSPIEASACRAPGPRVTSRDRSRWPGRSPPWAGRRTKTGTGFVVPVSRKSLPPRV